jgi:hypothetical protein
MQRDFVLISEDWPMAPTAPRIRIEIQGMKWRGPTNLFRGDWAKKAGIAETSSGEVPSLTQSWAGATTTKRCSQHGYERIAVLCKASIGDDSSKFREISGILSRSV